MNSNIHQGYIRGVDTVLEADDISAAFNLDLNPANPRNNVIEYFYFVDGNGNMVTPSGDGEVTITMSSGGEIYQTIFNGNFTAILANSPERGKPNGYGRVEKIRITFSGTITGATGFRALLSQNA